MKCRHCPVTSGSCVGERGQAFACRWAATGNPVQAAAIIHKSGQSATKPPGIAPPPHPAPTAQPAAPVTVSAYRDLAARMKACPHWVARTDCGCGVNYCNRDSREVSRQDCFTCLKGADDV